MSNNPHHISLSAAAELTKKYREANPGAILAGKFSKAAVLELFNDPQSVGMRIYNGINSAGEQSLVLVGVDAAGNDLYNGSLEDFWTPSSQGELAPNPLNTK